MPTAIFEIGTEELPADAAWPLALQLGIHVQGALCNAGVQMTLDNPLSSDSHTDSAYSPSNEAGSQAPVAQTQTFFTPRRLALLLSDLPEASPAKTVVTHGPPVQHCRDADNQPTAALLGFARKMGVQPDDLEQAEVDGVLKVTYKQQQPGLPLEQLLPDLFAAATANLTYGRSMRWGDSDDSFIRPVRWLLAMLDDKVLPVQCFGLQAGNRTYGHRILANNPLTLKTASKWPELLREKGYVEPSIAKRTDLIRDQAEKAAPGNNSEITWSLLDEIANLVEWPVALLCHFDEKHLQLPPEVVCAVLERHQRYLPVRNSDTGTLSNAFIAVANLESTDANAVIAGNQRVVHPRLEDAAFFFAQDTAESLQAHCQRLESIQFHTGLGSLADKCQRLTKLAPDLAQHLDDFGSEDLKHLKRAAELARVDQASQMVQEFAHLQGIMASHYARLAGEPEVVWKALREHYWVPPWVPNSVTKEGNIPPSSRPSEVLILADRLDSLCGLVMSGEQPSAERDPLGLRRLAMTIGYTVLDLKMSVPVADLVATACGKYPKTLTADAKCQSDIAEFIWGRFETICRQSGFTPELFAAARPCSTDLYSCQQRMQALQDFAATPKAAPVAEVVRRCRNILRSAKEDAKNQPLPKNASDAEKQLQASLDSIAKDTAKLVQSGEYLKALECAAPLAEPLSNFFEQVMVMDEDPDVRAARLGLLQRCLDVFSDLADLGALAQL